MVAETAEQKKPESKEKPATGKKARPTNCAECNKRIRRKNWFSRKCRNLRFEVEHQARWQHGAFFFVLYS